MPSISTTATTIFRCRACKENRTQLAYYYDKCHFYLDVECALMFTGIFEGQNYILNNYHQHPLILCNKEKERNDHVVSCDGCNQVIYGEIYGCLHCGFYLHRLRAIAPRQIKHLLHPEHPFTLFYDDNWWCKLSILKALDENGKVKYLRHKHFSIILDDKENEVFCGVCDKRNICGPSYECNRCSFFIHQDCLEPTEEEVQHPFHPHDRLIVVLRKTLPRRKFTCEACHNRCSGGFPIDARNPTMC